MCGAEVARHVERARAHETRIERVVGVIATALVVLVFAMTAGLGLVEGVLAYAGAGAVMFYVAKRTFR
jgi:predicted lysophospholipase L1 biosynthesis ABC-type transport system permease subunit